MKHTSYLTLVIISLAGAVSASDASASTMTYLPNNGAVFPGADPNGNALMQGTVVKPKNTNAVGNSNSLSNAQTVEQSVLTATTTKLENQIFGGGSGSQDLGGGHSISWTTVGNIETVTFNDNGTITSVQIPFNN